MLPPFIIEQIRRREEKERQQEQPRLELPMVPPSPARKEEADEVERGVIVVELL